MTKPLMIYITLEKDAAASAAFLHCCTTKKEPSQSMKHGDFQNFFQGRALQFLVSAIDLALSEDGRDFTSEAVFSEQDAMRAQIRAKQDAVVAGARMIPLILERTAAFCGLEKDWTLRIVVNDGERVAPGDAVALIEGSARLILKAERIILNFLTHLSGVATLTNQYVQALEGTGVVLLDTRKTLPGLRYPEKYAVLSGGAANHRLNLEAMLMLKDNHIDAAGGIAPAVRALRARHSPCPPIEVECRTLEDVREAVSVRVERIMLDNMTPRMQSEGLSLIPPDIEAEISGNVSLETIRDIACRARRRPDFISVGRITHSAPSADFSMTVMPIRDQEA